MKKRTMMPLFLTILFAGALSHAKLNDRQSMKCINADRPTQSALRDLEQAYEMRSISAKVFFQAFDKANTCPQLRKNLQKLHGDMLARLPVPQSKPATSPSFDPSGPGMGSPSGTEMTPSSGVPVKGPGAEDDELDSLFE
jgi:hypothetical protein